jgi:hypothetical protein
MEQRAVEADVGKEELAFVVAGLFWPPRDRNSV